MPTDPDKYEPTSIAQIVKAEKELFSLMAKECPSGIKQKPNRSFPLEAAMRKYLNSPRIFMLI